MEEATYSATVKSKSGALFTVRGSDYASFEAALHGAGYVIEDVRDLPGPDELTVLSLIRVCGDEAGLRGLHETYKEAWSPTVKWAAGRRAAELKEKA